MRSPYAFWRAPAALNVLSSFLVRKTISTLGQDFNYLMGNTLYGPARRSKKNSVTYGKYVRLFHSNTSEMIEAD